MKWLRDKINKYTIILQNYLNRLINYMEANPLGLKYKIGNIKYKIKSKIISFFADIRIYPGGIILFGKSSYRISGDSMSHILSIIEPGDILLRRYDHYLGTKFIKGYWTHAALYVGDRFVIHMLGEGITKENLLTFMRCDDIAILRYSGKDYERLRSRAIELAYIQFENRIQYDFDFNTDTPIRFYCTELCCYCYGYPDFRKDMGKIIYPDDMLYSIWKIIWSGLRNQVDGGILHEKNSDY